MLSISSENIVLVWRCVWGGGGGWSMTYCIVNQPQQQDFIKQSNNWKKKIVTIKYLVSINKETSYYIKVVLTIIIHVPSYYMLYTVLTIDTVIAYYASCSMKSVSIMILTIGLYRGVENKY